MWNGERLMSKKCNVAAKKYWWKKLGKGRFCRIFANGNRNNNESEYEKNTFLHGHVRRPVCGTRCRLHEVCESFHRHADRRDGRPERQHVPRCHAASGNGAAESRDGELRDVGPVLRLRLQLRLHIRLHSHTPEWHGMHRPHRCEPDARLVGGDAQTAGGTKTTQQWQKL